MPDPNPEVDADIPLARAGSTDALGRALNRLRPYLLAAANRRLDPVLRAKGGASDIVQETFLEAQRDFGRFTGSTGGELRAWLLTLLTNNASNFARTYKGTDKRQVGREVALPGETPSGARAGGLAGTMPTPSMAAMADEQEVLLECALARLPEDYRRVLVLRNREDRPFDAIATLMDRSENAVRKLWFRAVEQLQQELDQS